MKYNGLNKKGFERDARLFNDYMARLTEEYAEENAEKIADAAADLADAYGINRADIWDYLGEYALHVTEGETV